MPSIIAETLALDVITKIMHFEGTSCEEHKHVSGTLLGSESSCIVAVVNGTVLLLVSDATLEIRVILESEKQMVVLLMLLKETFGTKVDEGNMDEVLHTFRNTSKCVCACDVDIKDPSTCKADMVYELDTGAGEDVLILSAGREMAKVAYEELYASTHQYLDVEADGRYYLLFLRNDEPNRIFVACFDTQSAHSSAILAAMKIGMTACMATPFLPEIKALVVERFTEILR